jgi:hypothetical protein
LSHFKGLRRHFRVARATSAAEPKAAVDLAVIAFWIATRRKKDASERNLSPNETSGFATLVVSY